MNPNGINNDGNENNTFCKPETRSFWRDGLSIDESRTSVLIICLLLSLIFTVVMYLKTGEINGNWTTIVIAIIYAVAGVNVVNSGLGYMNTQRSTPINYQQPLNTVNPSMSQISQINKQPTISSQITPRNDN